MSTMTAFVPSDFDMDTVYSRKIGELLLSRADGTLYYIYLDPVTKKKVAGPIKGDASYKLIQVLRHMNVLQTVAPTHPDITSTWYHTDLAYVQATENTPKQAAYISIKVPTADGNFKWTKILPITEAKYVYIGAKTDETGELKPITLAEIVNKSGDGLRILPAGARETGGSGFLPAAIDDDTAVAEFKRVYNSMVTDKVYQGEVYLKTVGDVTTINLKMADGSADKVLAIPNSVDTLTLLKHNIEMGKKPVNWHANTVWYATSNDTPMTATENYLHNAKTLFMHKVKDNAQKMGLHWEVKPTELGENAQAVQSDASGKIVRFRPDAIAAPLVQKVSFRKPEINGVKQPIFEAGSLYYFEVEVIDSGNNARLVLYNNNITEMSSLIDLESQGAANALVLSHDGWYVNTSDKKTNTKYEGFSNKTVFFMVHVPVTGKCSVAWGYVNDLSRDTLSSGHLTTYIAGSAPIVKGEPNDDWIKLDNIDNFAIYARAQNSLENGTAPLVMGSINKFKIPFLPESAIGLNNELKNENAFERVVLATNANSVFLENGNTLDTIIPSGRIITTLRTYDETENGLQAKPGELIVEKLRNNDGTDVLDTTNPADPVPVFQLRYITDDGHAVRVVSKYEDLMAKHLKASVNVSNALISSLTVDEDDKAIVYYDTNFYTAGKENESNWTNAVTKTNLINANPVIAVKDKSGNWTYKLVMPNTTTDYVFHTESDSEGVVTRRIPISTLIDELHATDKKIDNKHIVYHTWEELPGTADSDLPTLFNQSELHGLPFINNIVNRLPANGIFTTNIDPNGKELIQRMFGIDKVGQLTIQKGQTNTDPVHISIKDNNGIEHRAVFTPAIANTNNRPSMSEFTLVSTRKQNENGKIIDTVDELTVNDKLAVRGNTELGDTKISSLTVNGTADTDTRGLSATNASVDPNPFNLINYTYNPSTRDNIIKVGNDLRRNKVVISSSTKPVWKNTTNNQEFDLLTPADLKGYYTFKGILNPGGILKSLDGYNDSTSAGYYTYAYNGTDNIAGKGLPNDGADITKCNMLLEVCADTTSAGLAFDNRVIMQKLHIYKTTATGFTVNSYYRVYDVNATWKPWVEIPNIDDVNNKLDISKNNQTVTGTVKFDNATTKDLKVNNTVTFDNSTGPNAGEESNGIIKLKDAAGTIDVLKASTTNTGDNATITLGNNTNVSSVNIVTKDNARPTANGNNLAYESDVTTLNNKFTNYPTILEMNNRLSGIATADAITETVNKTLHKDVDDSLSKTLSLVTDGSDHGTLAVGKDNTSDNSNNSIVFRNNSKLKLPTYYNPVETESDFDSKPITDFNNTVRYDIIKSGEGILTASVSDALNGVPTSTTVTGVQLKGKKVDGDNKSKFSIRNIYGNATRGRYADLLTSDDLVKSFTANVSEFSSEKVASAELTKLTWDKSLGRHLSDNMLPTPDTTHNNGSRGAYVNNLPVGEYLLPLSYFDQLGLDKAKFNNKPVLLMVYDKYTLDGQNIRRLEVISTDGKLFASGYSHAVEGVNWVYSDLNGDNFYNKTETDKKITALSDTLADFTQSMDYTNLNTETNVGANRISKTIYILPANDKRKLAFSSTILPEGITNGNIVITIKGATGYADPVDLQISIAINDSNKVESTVHNIVPGSTILISDLSYNINTRVIQFVLRDKSGRSTKNTGLNVFTQLFGPELAPFKNLSFNVDYTV